LRKKKHGTSDEDNSLITLSQQLESENKQCKPLIDFIKMLLQSFADFQDALKENAPTLDDDRRDAYINLLRYGGVILLFLSTPSPCSAALPIALAELGALCGQF
jgi:hypothetical protein